MSGNRTALSLGSLRLLANCDKGHKVVGLMDGDFVMCEVHIPGDTPLREIDSVVRKLLESQL